MIFSHGKEVCFDRWCNSRDVDTDFENLREIISIEKFKRCAHNNSKTYPDGQNVAYIQKQPLMAMIMH